LLCGVRGDDVHPKGLEKHLERFSVVELVVHQEYTESEGAVGSQGNLQSRSLP
jgi:hypothetical protein